MSSLRPNDSGKSKSGFSLLEVVLALAILALSFIALGQLVSTGIRGANGTRDLTNAQLYAESVMAEVMAGSIELAPVAEVPVPVAPDWSYSIVLVPTEDQYLLSLQVTVSRETVRGPVAFTLMRWIRDPDQMLPLEEIEAANEAAEEAT